MQVEYDAILAGHSELDEPTRITTLCRMLDEIECRNPPTVVTCQWSGGMIVFRQHNIDLQFSNGGSPHSPHVLWIAAAIVLLRGKFWPDGYYAPAILDNYHIARWSMPENIRALKRQHAARISFETASMYTLDAAYVARYLEPAWVALQARHDTFARMIAPAIFMLPAPLVAIIARYAMMHVLVRPYYEISVKLDSRDGTPPRFANATDKGNTLTFTLTAPYDSLTNMYICLEANTYCVSKAPPKSRMGMASGTADVDALVMKWFRARTEI